MPCFSPKPAGFRTRPDGKKEIVFGRQSQFSGYTPIELPCGRCSGCLIDRARHWATRCQLEALESPDNWFVTLTYDDEHIPWVQSATANPNTGEVLDEVWLPTLRKSDARRFIHDLRQLAERRRGESGIRFFLSGEYGDQTQRPHYHCLLFNYRCPDLILFKKCDGIAYFVSDEIATAWPYGQALLTYYSFETGAYVAGYVLKKCKARLNEPFGCDDEPVYVDGRQKEFINMSRRPGIGRRFYDEKGMYIYEYDGIVVPSGSFTPAHVVKPPPYFDRLMADTDPDLMVSVKERRKALALVGQREELIQHGFSLDDSGKRKLLEIKAEKSLKKVLTNTRDLC